MPGLLVVLGLAAVVGAIVSPSDKPRGEHDIASVPGSLPAARVEGRAAHYHLTFADFARWRIKTDAPTRPGAEADRWLTYGFEDVHVIAMVIPIESPDLDSSVDLVLKGSKKQFSSFTELERTPLTDRADRGVLVRIQGSRDGSMVEMLMGFFADEGAVYEITALTSPKTFSRLGRELEAAVRSFELPSPEPVPTMLPNPPLSLTPPPTPSAMSTSVDVHEQDPGLLARRARAAATKGDYPLAVQLQHGAVADGVRGKYDLACYYGRVGQIDASLYWLQRAIDEGVDPKWAERDPDLAKIRADPRWGTIRIFLREAARYWAGSGLKQTRVVIPKGYTRGQPIPVVIGLHGMGSIPDDLAGEGLQGTADALSIAFVSASGTIPNGPSSFHWAESADSDDARLDDALKEVSDRVTIAPGKIILIGFSQGAQMAAEIAARRPEKYLGAIVMSPGTQKDLALQDLVAKPALAQRRFVIVVGAGEHPGNVARAATDARALRGAHADVFHKAYEGMTVHSFPPDFTSALPVWIRYILGSGPKPPGEPR
jgi:predicted esterase